MKPHIHDKIMSRSQAIAFLFGKLSSQLKLSPSILDTQGVTMILTNQHIVESDTDELFHDLLHFNPYVSAVLAEFKNSTTEVINKIMI